MMKKHNGFTVIEVLFITVLFGIASVFFFIQKHNLQVAAVDNTRKTSINAMYYSLEEVFYPANGYYPQTISTDNLKAVDPALFTDPSGIKLGDKDSTYIYSPLDCSDKKCKNYILTAKLQNEADFVKKSNRK
ncbi:type II secretion system protein [Candidatus Saccharibacteria bacterium]|nr:type II secretion system protein [Candidatus Saccharibacteria bacterium]